MVKKTNSFLSKNISNRLAYTIISVFALILVIVFVYAQNIPNPGHSISQIGTPAGCSANQFLKWDGNAWVCSNVEAGGGGGGENIWTANGNNIYYNNGNVGIGTNTPREKFQIGNLFTFHDGGQKVIARNFYYDGQDKRIIQGNSSSIYFGDGDLKFNVAGNGASNSQIIWNNALTINNNGNVGIGTNSPQTKLDVIGNVNITQNLFIKERLGIGTTNPSEKLHIEGNAIISGTAYAGGTEARNKLNCVVVPSTVSCPLDIARTSTIYYATERLNERAGNCGGFALVDCPGGAYAPQDHWYNNNYCCERTNQQGYSLNTQYILCC